MFNKYTAKGRIFLPFVFLASIFEGGGPRSGGRSIATKLSLMKNIQTFVIILHIVDFLFSVCYNQKVVVLSTERSSYA